MPPSSTAGSELRPPPNLPIGVRAPATITDPASASLRILDLHARRVQEAGRHPVEADQEQQRVVGESVPKMFSGRPPTCGEAARLSRASGGAGSAGAMRGAIPMNRNRRGSPHAAETNGAAAARGQQPDLLDVQPRDRLRHAGRLLLALDRDRHLVDDLDPALDVLDGNVLDGGPHLRADLHRRREAHPVEPVVDAHPHAVDLEQPCGQGRDQGERQEAMGDRSPKGSLLGALHIDVDPLVVTGRVGELVDAVLVDLQPPALAERLALQRLVALDSTDRLHLSMIVSSGNFASASAWTRTRAGRGRSSAGAVSRSSASTVSGTATTGSSQAGQAGPTSRLGRCWRLWRRRRSGSGSACWSAPTPSATRPGWRRWRRRSTTSAEGGWSSASAPAGMNPSIRCSVSTSPSRSCWSIASRRRCRSWTCSYARTSPPSRAGTTSSGRPPSGRGRSSNHGRR